MKKIFLILFFLLISNSAYAQTCGCSTNTLTYVITEANALLLGTPNAGFSVTCSADTYPSPPIQKGNYYYYNASGSVAGYPAYIEYPLCWYGDPRMRYYSQIGAKYPASFSVLLGLINEGRLTYEELSLIDSDGDGIDDYSEIMQSDGDYLNELIQPAEGNITPAGTDTDLDGIVDSVEIRLGLDPNVPNDMLSGDFSDTTITNLDPLEEKNTITIRIGSGTELDPYEYIILDEFTIPGLVPFSEPSTYTLGNYGGIPDGLQVKICKNSFNDGIFTGDYDSCEVLTPNVEGNIINDDSTTWETLDPDNISYTGGGTYVPNTIENPEITLDNLDTAESSWDSITDPFTGTGIIFPASTSATVQIDPSDIAGGINLAGAGVVTSPLGSITETEDPEISSQISGTDGLISDLGGTGYAEGDVLTSGALSSAIGLLSWVSDLYSIPAIGQASSFTINGFIYNGREFPDFVLNFDYAIVSVFRVAFLFFFYLSTIWVFFRLTRYAWG